MRAVLALSPSRCHTRSACGSYLFRAQLLSGSSCGSWMPHSSYMLMVAVCGVVCVTLCCLRGGFLVYKLYHRAAKLHRLGAVLTLRVVSVCNV